MLDVLNKVSPHLPKLTSAFSKCTWCVESPILRTSSSVLWCLLPQSNVVRCLRSEEMGIQIHLHARIDNLWHWSNLFLAMCQVSIFRWILCFHFRDRIRTRNSGNGCESVRSHVHTSNR